MRVTRCSSTGFEPIEQVNHRAAAPTTLGALRLAVCEPFQIILGRSIQIARLFEVKFRAIEPLEAKAGIRQGGQDSAERFPGGEQALIPSGYDKA